MGHVLHTNDDCPYPHKHGDVYDIDNCPVCDWGLAICRKCGKAECDLEKPCIDGESSIEAPVLNGEKD